jgi:hypothetical protein
MSYMFEPSFCMIAQGAKRVLFGDETYVYDARHFLITSADLPTVVQVIQPNREKPCLSLMLKPDQQEISQLMADSHLPPPRVRESSRGMATGEVTVPLLTAFQRLIDLLDEPKNIPILARSSSGRSFTVYLWAIKVRVCARWRRREVQAIRLRRQSSG